MTVAVVLAGGLGTRLRSVVPDMPKPMADVQGNPFLSYLLTYWADQGVKSFVLSVGYKRESIIKFFGSSFCGIPIEYVQEQQPLGTGGALILASSRLHEPFLLLNGDTFFRVQLEPLINFHASNNSKFTYTLFRATESDRYGAINLAPNSTRIELIGNAPAMYGGLANAGVYLVDPTVLISKEIKIGSKYSLEDELVPQLLDKNVPLHGFEVEGEFIDIGVPHDYFKAVKNLPKFVDVKNS